MEARKLEFDGKVELLTLDELRQTVKAKEAGIRKSVEHFQVFDDVMEIIDKEGIKINTLPIYASGGANAKRIEIAEKYVGEKALPAWYLDKVSGEVSFPDFDNQETSMKVRIEFCERGITTSVGKLVLVCTNGMTAFKGDIASTYGSNKMGYESLLNNMKIWIHELQEKNDIYNGLIDRMKNVAADAISLESTIGKLQMLAVGQAYCGGEKAPFNIGQVSNFTKSIILQNDEKEINNLWDLYNIGTNIQKPDLMDMSQISNNNYELTQFFMNEYLQEEVLPAQF